MPKVPIAQNRVGIAGLTDAKIQAPDLSGTGLEVIGQGLRAMGAAGMEHAQALHELAMSHAEADAKDADSQLMIAGSTLENDPQTGLYRKSGRDAVEAVNPALDAYKAKISDIRGTLKTRMARDLFDRVSKERFAIFQNSVSRFAVGEQTKWDDQAAASRISLSGDDAASNWQDETRFNTSVATGLSEIEKQFSPFGGDAVKTKQKEFVSGVRRRVVESMRVADPVGAAAYMEDHKAELTVDDLTRLKDSLYEPLLERQASADVDAGMASVGAGPVPAVTAPTPSAGSGSNLSRMIVITARTESGGKERDGAGNLVTSPKGAQGKMQVMPGTNTDPGFGVRPAADNSDAERTRVGRDYLAAMMKRYGGDPAKAWAAYNGGPGRVDEAVRKNGENWLSAMPKETRDYVATNTAALGGSGGPDQPTYAPRKDDLNTLYAWIDAQPWSFDRKKAARAEADNRVARDDRLRDRDQADARDRAYTIVDGLGPDGLKSTSQIPAPIWNRLSPEVRLTLKNEIQRNAAPKPVESYGDQFLALHALAFYRPDEFIRTDLRKYKGLVTPGEFSELFDSQARMRTAPADKPVSVPMSRVWTVVDRHAPDIGLDLGVANGKPRNPAARQDSQNIVGMMMRDLSSITGNKREPTDQEIKAAFDRAVMTVKRVVPGWFSDKTEVLPRYKVAPGETYRVSVPNDKRDAIVAEFRRQGNANPSEADIARIYINTYGGQ